MYGDRKPFSLTLFRDFVWNVRWLHQSQKVLHKELITCIFLLKVWIVLLRWFHLHVQIPRYNVQCNAVLHCAIQCN